MKRNDSIRSWLTPEIVSPNEIVSMVDVRNEDETLRVAEVTKVPPVAGRASDDARRCSAAVKIGSDTWMAAVLVK